MPELSQDEFTVLLLADKGESMIPIGRWKTPILALTERGLMQRNDEVNYGITLAGREACAERDREDDAAMLRLLEGNSKTIEARANEIEVEPLIAEELKDA